MIENTIHDRKKASDGEDGRDTIKDRIERCDDGQKIRIKREFTKHDWRLEIRNRFTSISEYHISRHNNYHIFSCAGRLGKEN